MKERLVELLNKKYDHFCDQCGVNKDSHYTDNLAEYLLANGVIVPPCKVGDVVYLTTDCTGNMKRIVTGFTQDAILSYAMTLPMSELGNTIFLTPEEAQAKLKEGGKE